MKSIDTADLIRAALNELGLSEGYLKYRLGVPLHEVRFWNSEILGATEWFRICEILHISCETNDSYHSSLYRLRIKRAYLEGRLNLPRTLRIQEWLAEAETEERKGFLFVWRTGRPAQWARQTWNHFRCEMRRRLTRFIDNLIDDFHWRRYLRVHACRKPSLSAKTLDALRWTQGPRTIRELINRPDVNVAIFHAIAAVNRSDA
jgi:hypothetical protein